MSSKGKILIGIQSTENRIKWVDELIILSVQDESKMHWPYATLCQDEMAKKQ